MERRTLIRLLGVTMAGSTAGCATGGNGGEPSPTTTDSPTPTPTDTATPTETETPTPPEMTDTPTQQPENGLVIVTSDESASATVDRIEADIEESPLTLLTTIDHAENAASADLELPPTTLLMFGNPAVGTPLMQDSRTVAIDLPQKMLIWSEDDETKVAYNDPTYLAERHDIDGQTDRLEQIRSVLDGLATGA